jgi:hypothetical protein
MTPPDRQATASLRRRPWWAFSGDFAGTHTVGSQISPWVSEILALLSFRLIFFGIILGVDSLGKPVELWEVS